MEADRVAAKAATPLFNSFELRLWCNASRVEFWKIEPKIDEKSQLCYILTVNIKKEF